MPAGAGTGPASGRASAAHRGTSRGYITNRKA